MSHLQILVSESVLSFALNLGTPWTDANHVCENIVYFESDHSQTHPDKEQPLHFPSLRQRASFKGSDAIRIKGQRF